MSDVLSQAEIDSLLSALDRGEVNAEEMLGTENEQRVRNYDFRRAMRFSKDHIRIISRIHEQFARLLSTNLAAQLRTIIQIQVESVDQVPYEEFVQSVPALTILEVLDFAPMEGHVVIEINPQIIFAMLDRVMGGVAKGPYRERELTEIEQSLLERTLGRMPEFLGEAWKTVERLEPSFVSLETNPQFLQLATSNETVLVVTLSARIGEATGLMNICIPHVTVEPIIPKLTTQYLYDVSKSRNSTGYGEQEMEAHLHQVDVDLQAELGAAELTVDEVLDLQVGDIIPLSNSIRDAITVTVDGIPTFTGQVGTRHKHYAVQIIQSVKGGGVNARKGEAVSGGN
ncbi:flagellar motor switch protein FliM [Alicyclobacillus sp. SO9]|uniref:flagellar motor switch protein FliM n=1 Tax=Alicyclobacillus sp. SO9 TaxID=2665646 RepID=UPI0018E7107D|nr:flagellar motor switch protein FliM [Alicyclobacillus sp. SO9]QQE80814.1 flagellar motor switch protein FliM [Alicyclobacillus sp. SO9]